MSEVDRQTLHSTVLYHCGFHANAVLTQAQHSAIEGKHNSFDKELVHIIFHCKHIS